MQSAHHVDETGNVFEYSNNQWVQIGTLSPVKNSGRPVIRLVIFLASLLVVIAVPLIILASLPSKPVSVPIEDQVWQLAQAAFLENSNTPKTVDFGGQTAAETVRELRDFEKYYEDEIKNDGLINVYKVSFHADQANKYGQEIREDHLCNVFVYADGDMIAGSWMHGNAARGYGF